MYSRWNPILSIGCASLLFAACGSPNDTSTVVEVRAAAIDSTSEYARRCDEVIRTDADQPATVPAFNCEAGSEVPQNVTGDLSTEHGTKCDRPNRLNSECDPGSKFQVLYDDNSATVVAHCRKKQWEGHAPEDGHFGDIAVIQYSKKNGATCFYQAGPDSDLFPGVGKLIPAPSKDPNNFWHQPSEMHECLNCHNNGPLIRSQYLAQLNLASPQKHKLPEQIDFNTSTHQTHKEGAPYWFPGSDFSPVHIYSVRSRTTCV